MKKTEMLSIAVGCGGLLFGAGVLTAGPLDPPSGAIAPTYKTLTEVEPRIAINATNTPGDADSTFKITEPGSYYLTQNHVTNPGPFIGIEIAASNVTIDFNGYTLSGDNLTTRPGIHCTNVFDNIAIRNGMIVAYQASGIDLFSATNTAIENMSVKLCTSGGYYVGSVYRIVRCMAVGNGGHGFYTNGRGVIEDSVANQNGSFGFYLASHGSATSCTATANGTRGFDGVFATFSNCSASRSTIGFNVVGSTLDGCATSECGEIGFKLDSSTATACTSMYSVLHGFSAVSSTVSQCVANYNNNNGMVASYDTIIRDSTCMYNGVTGNFAGILITGDGNRVEGNNCGFQDIGIQATGTRNFIARNTCRGNANNWNVTATNTCLVVSAATSGAINGNSGGVGPGSTDPNANYSY